MAFWIKASLWTAVVVLPGGVLLLPVIYAVHRRERDCEPAEQGRAAPDVIVPDQ